MRKRPGERGVERADRDGNTVGITRKQEAAAWAPLLCGAHCALVPAVAALAPGLAVPHAIEHVFMASALILAAVVLHAGLRAHRCWRVFWPVGAGLACWSVALSAPVHGGAGVAPEWLTGGVGGVLLFAGLRWNARLRHGAERGCAYCDGTADPPEERNAPAH